ncbi:MAG: hypothetical protein MUF08_14435 [Burkholderiaceae bacterium]|jgi:hypothetical protein|nr:hypothetical protein [Burkholderiaceae bacterium]MCU0966210.1 hypothetical protein [Burkholderiaceae bacterium]
MKAGEDALPITGHVHVDDLARALQACSARLAEASPLEAALADFKAQVRALFDAEEACLVDADEALRDEQRAEREEFEAFADEVLSATHFDGAEMQRFAEAWCTGHLRSAAARLAV